MGNRAVIAFSTGGFVCHGTPCVYLHWNGGLASVQGFLQAARDLGYANLKSETARRDAFARMTQAWFGHGSVYIGQYFQQDTDNGDNGTYVVDESLNILSRRFVPKRHGDEVDPIKTTGIYDQCFSMGAVLGPALESVELAS